MDCSLYSIHFDARFVLSLNVWCIKAQKDSLSGNNLIQFCAIIEVVVAFSPVDHMTCNSVLANELKSQALTSRKFVTSIRQLILGSQILIRSKNKAGCVFGIVQHVPFHWKLTVFDQNFIR